MAVVTYYSLFSSAVTVFTGFTTNTGSQCASPSTFPAYAQLSLTNSLCAGSSPRAQSNAIADYMRFATPAYAAATDVVGGNVQVYIRKPSTKGFWLESYTSAGVLSQTTVANKATVTGSSILVNVSLTAQSLQVPAGGFLVLRTDATGTSVRFYFGTNPKGQGLPSLLLTVTETPAITGPQATITATGAGGQATIVADVQLISVTHTFQSDAGTPLADGINVVAFEASTMSNANPTVVGNAAIAGGAGSVTVICSTTNPVILVPDHAHPSFPTGEVGHSPPITPTVV